MQTQNQRYRCWLAPAFLGLATVSMWVAAAAPSRAVPVESGHPLVYSGNGASLAIPDAGHPISADGRYVVFTSTASDLVAGVSDGNKQYDGFVYDRITHSNSLLSRRAGSPHVAAGGNPVAISGDGKWVLMGSTATDLVRPSLDLVGHMGIFLVERETNKVLFVSHAFGSATTGARGFTQARGLSVDGSQVLLDSAADNLVSGQVDPERGNDVFLFDRNSGLVSLVSHAAGSTATAANKGGRAMGISADGNTVLFGSYSNNLVAGLVDDRYGEDLFLFNRVDGTQTLVSRKAGAPTRAANSPSNFGLLSADGQWVVFSTMASDVAVGVAEGNAQVNLFLFDRTRGSSRLISHALGSQSVPANGEAYPGAISADGRWVVFLSGATNIIGDGSKRPLNGLVYLYDRISDTSTLVSHVADSATTPASGSSTPIGISADGQRVLYESTALNLTSGRSGRPNSSGIFLFDRASGNSVLVAPSAGTGASGPVTTWTLAAISAEGRWVGFQSPSPDIAPWTKDVNAVSDIFLFSSESGTSELVSRSAAPKKAPE